MMNKVRVLTYLVIGLVALNLVVLGSLFLKSSKKHRHHVPKIKSVLKFDKAQIESFDGLKETHRIESRAIQEELSKLSTRFYLAEDSILRDSIYDLIEAQNRRLYQLNDGHFRDLKALCSPEQLEKFPLFMDKLMNDRSRRPRRKGKKHK